MALKDRLNDALAETDNAARRETLRAVLAAAGGGSDAEIQTAIARLISEREQKAATYNVAGQTGLAKAERAEIDALRVFLRFSNPEATAPAARKPAAAKPEPAPKSGPAPEGPRSGEAKPLLTRTQMIIAAVAVVVLAAVVFFLLRPTGGSEETQAANTNTKVVLRSDDRTLGNPKAPVVMLEYAAPTCPHCGRFALTVMPRIKAEYIDTGKVFYIFRTFPLSATDGAVEGIARCLPADKYFQFLDLMFRNQPKWDPDGYVVPDVGAAVKQLAQVMGIGPEQADRCMTDSKEQERINAVSREAVVKYNLQGTPTFIINGTVVQASDSTWPAMKARLDSLLSRK
jgi:protein-disulfide isomerase